MRFRIDLKILIFLIIFYFTKQLELYLGIMLFCFIHEIGHLIMGLLLGLKPDKIDMIPFGFFLKFKTNTKINNKKVLKTNILVALAGPVTNLIIIFLILFLHISFIGRDIVVYINLLIFAFNLIPIYPLDGGRILKGVLEVFLNKIESDIIINKISNYFMILLTMISSIAIYYFKNIAILATIGYLWILIIRENKKLSIKKRAWNLCGKV